MKRVISLLLILCMTGCASTTMIKSVPDGATIFLNGEKVGTTPYTHTDTKIIGARNSVILKKDGFQDFSTTFVRDEEANIGPIIGGFFVMVPFLWALGYKPIHSYEMEAKKTQ